MCEPGWSGESELFQRYGDDCNYSETGGLVISWCGTIVALILGIHICVSLVRMVCNRNGRRPPCSDLPYRTHVVALIYTILQFIYFVMRAADSVTVHIHRHIPLAVVTWLASTMFWITAACIEWVFIHSIIASIRVDGTNTAVAAGGAPSTGATPLSPTGDDRDRTVTVTVQISFPIRVLKNRSSEASMPLNTSDQLNRLIRAMVLPLAVFPFCGSLASLVSSIAPWVGSRESDMLPMIRLWACLIIIALLVMVGFDYGLAKRLSVVIGQCDSFHPSDSPPSLKSFRPLLWESDRSLVVSTSGIVRDRLMDARRRVWLSVKCWIGLSFMSVPTFALFLFWPWLRAQLAYLNPILFIVPLFGNQIIDPIHSSIRRLMNLTSLDIV
jgi:hypothetical protein